MLKEFFTKIFSFKSNIKAILGWKWELSYEAFINNTVSVILYFFQFIYFVLISIFELIDKLHWQVIFGEISKYTRPSEANGGLGVFSNRDEPLILELFRDFESKHPGYLNSIINFLFNTKYFTLTIWSIIRKIYIAISEIIYSPYLGTFYFLRFDKHYLSYLMLTNSFSLYFVPEFVPESKQIQSSNFKYFRKLNFFYFSDKAKFMPIEYDSYTTHLYLIFYSIIEIPFLFLKILISIFNYKTYFFFFKNINNFFLLEISPISLVFNLFEDIFDFFFRDLYQFFTLYINVSNQNNKITITIQTINFDIKNFSLFCETVYYIQNYDLKAKFVGLNSWYKSHNISYFDIYNFFLFKFFISLVKQFFFFLNIILLDSKTYFTFSIFYQLLDKNVRLNFKNYLYFNINNFWFNYSSGYFLNADSVFRNSFDNFEFNNSSRYKRFENPVFKYDYKSGDYFPKLNKDFYTYLFSTIINVTSGLRTAPWFFSNSYLDIFNINFSNFVENNFSNIKSNKFTNTDAFYIFFKTQLVNFNFNNQKWVSCNVLNQKFYRMFNTSSMQQRIYSNWRQLKFTREAWRCKLLVARHQKNLFKRYVHEDGVFWSIERNAKDLIPGWAMITPFSSRIRFTAIGKTDIGLMGVLLVLNSSIISAANFLVTYRYLSTLNNRKMRDARAFFTEAVMVSSWMMILANPMLVIGIIMLLSDRHWQTSFFDYSGGGDTVLFQHMFWFFGHPEVYIIILPTFGFTNTMLSYYLRKRVSARASLLYSMYTIAFLGFFVWGHHMYMVGLSHTTRMLFSTLTVMISVPAATKIMHWCVTTVNSSFAMELPLLFTFTFIFFFVSGGISGMCVAHTGMDILFHDTFYVIGHFHVMLAGGAMFASFGAFYFYFPAIFGVKFSRIYAYLHYSYYLVGQLMTVIPMFWLGYAGMPRRVLDYPASLGGWHSVISAGHMLNVAGLMAFFIMIFDSLRQSRSATRNTFGINRYNTRLNFYIYEIAKVTYVSQKSFFLYKYIKNYSVKLGKSNYNNYEPLETTLLSYVFFKK